MLGSFPFVHLKLHESWFHWKNWSDVINKGTYRLNKTIQTTPTKTFRNRCMKLPFPSRQPSILHSSPLWLLVWGQVKQHLKTQNLKKSNKGTNNTKISAILLKILPYNAEFEIVRAQINLSYVTAAPFIDETTVKSWEVHHADANHISNKGQQWREEAKRKALYCSDQGEDSAAPAHTSGTP